jgi:acyl carrier protein
MASELRARPVPQPWKVEWKLVELFCESFGYYRTQIGPETRLADLPFDSLDVVELILDIEEAFSLSIPDRAAGQAFAAKHSIREWAAAIVEHWNAWPEPPPRRRWGHRQVPVSAGAAGLAPFLQVTGPLSSAHDRGPLYESLVPNREGFPQFRRRTDGMRCVAVPASDSCEALVIDAEPVSCAAYAHFLNSVGPPDEIVRDWCGVDAADRRRRHVPLTRGWTGRWRPERGADRWPMMLVSWYGANAYALWANRRDWRHYRADGIIPAALRGRRATIRRAACRPKRNGSTPPAGRAGRRRWLAIRHRLPATIWEPTTPWPTCHSPRSTSGAACRRSGCTTSSATSGNGAGTGTPTTRPRPRRRACGASAAGVGSGRHG